MDYILINNMNRAEIATTFNGWAITEPDYIPVSEEYLESVVNRILSENPSASITGIGLRTIRSFDGDIDGTYMSVIIG